MKQAALALLLATLIPLAAALAEEPPISFIGMSSSLSRFSPLHVPQGGLVYSNSLFVVIYNHADHAVTVELNYSAPPGIDVVFHPPEQVFELGAGEFRRVILEIRVSDTIVPGPYKINVTASEVREPGPGQIVVIPATTHTLVLVVEGEYADLVAVAVDPAGSVVSNALVRLYRVINGTELNILDSSTGVLRARVVPGDYVVRAYLMGEAVAEERFTLSPYEFRNITLVLRIVYFERFSVIPIISNETGDIVSARLRAVLKNVYRTINDTRVELVVARDGEVIERRDIVSAGTLPVGRTTYEFDYVPPTGWVPGNYTFQLIVYGLGDRVLAVSPVRWVSIRGGGPLEAITTYWWAIAAAGAVSALLVTRALWSIEIVDAWLDPYTRRVHVSVVNRGRRPVTIKRIAAKAAGLTASSAASARIPPGGRVRLSLSVSPDFVDAVREAGRGKAVVVGGNPLVRASRAFTVREA